jgi:hypothetical protein
MSGATRSGRLFLGYYSRQRHCFYWSTTGTLREPAKPNPTFNSPPDLGRLCVVRVDFGMQSFL